MKACKNRGGIIATYTGGLGGSCAAFMAKNIQVRWVSGLLDHCDKHLSPFPSHRYTLQLTPPPDGISGRSAACQPGLSCGADHICHPHTLPVETMGRQGGRDPAVTRGAGGWGVGTAAPKQSAGFLCSHLRKISTSRT